MPPLPNGSRTPAQNAPKFCEFSRPIVAPVPRAAGIEQRRRDVPGCLAGQTSATLRRIMSTLLRVASLLFVFGFQAAPNEPGWTSLFNGKDLTGWKVVTPAS